VRISADIQTGRSGLARQTGDDEKKRVLTIQTKHHRASLRLDIAAEKGYFDNPSPGKKFRVPL
jgi:hypothetical protein